MRVPFLGHPRPLTPKDKDKVLGHAVRSLRDPAHQVPARWTEHVDQLSKAIGNSASSLQRPRNLPGAPSPAPRPVSATQIAQRAAAQLQPSSSITPPDIEAALRAQGLDLVAPFAPGTPLAPFYGYGRQPRVYDYQVDRNVTTETRPDRIPFATLLHLWKAYDVAQACTRYSINDLRSMRVRVTAMEGYDDNPVKEIAEAKRFLRKPDGEHYFRNWLAQNQRNLWIFDSAPVFRQRDKAKHLKELINLDAPTIAVMLDYYGRLPRPPAPAFEQFVEGVPWDWLTTDDVIYHPFWPETGSPYGLAPLESVLVNANTDMRLQMFFLDFFTKGQVPEMLAIAPEGMTDSDALAELQEDYNDWTYGDQAERWGLRWLPAGTELKDYKPYQFDPDLAEYVMRRTIAQFGLTPQNLGILDDVNRATSDTQMDQQFRVSTLPIVGYYEDIFDEILQEDLSLPVQMRFDTGREKEDRLTEAQAWNVAVDFGAASADEYRDKVLGLPIDPENPVPRYINSQRLGPVPLSHVESISGELDPLTYAPAKKPSYRDYSIPGSSPGDDPQTAANNQDESAQARARPKTSTPKAGGPRRGRPDPSSVAANANGNATKVAMPGDPDPDPDPDPGDEDERDGYDGWGVDAQGAAANGTGAVRAELGKWRANARKAVKRGAKPRRFDTDVLPAETTERVWSLLKSATTRAEVDNAFIKGTEPPIAGLAVRAADTGRVLMIQRAKTEGDPAGGTWEFPGGHIDDGETSEDGALREWREETGLTLPDSASPATTWDSVNGVYRGHVYEIPSEDTIDLRDRDAGADPDGDYFEAIAWWDPADLSTNPTVRPELASHSQIVQHALQRSVLKAWHDQPRGHQGKWRSSDQALYETFHRNTDRIVDHYTPQIRQAMSEALSLAVVHKAVAEAYGTAETGIGMQKAGSWRDLLRLAQRATQRLRRALGHLYSDAYLQGAHEAASTSHGEMPPWTAPIPIPDDYWTDWTPAVADETEQLAQGGLADILRDAGVWIKDMTDTQVDRIGDAITRGVEHGFPVRQVLAEVNAIVNDETRARLIAETEYARAQGRAAMDTYRANGVPMLRWLAEPTACPACQSNAAASPQPTTNPLWPAGPIPVHPHCRCAEAPYYPPRE